MAMSEFRLEQVLAGQSALARKVFQIVPIQEWWAVSDIYGAIRAQGTSAEARVIRRCLGELKDAGLIREPVNAHFQRTAPIQKPKREQVMLPIAAQNVLSIKRPETGALDALAALSGEVIALADDFGQRMKKLAVRIEEVALSVEIDRESTAEKLENLKRLQQFLKGLQE